MTKSIWTALKASTSSSSKTDDEVIFEDKEVTFDARDYPVDFLSVSRDFTTMTIRWHDTGEEETMPITNWLDDYGNLMTIGEDSADFIHCIVAGPDRDGGWHNIMTECLTWNAVH